MQAGIVTTGYSHPKVAVYNGDGGSDIYANGMTLARGVSNSMEIESSEDNDFYADNQIAESDSGTFSSGSNTVTVDGLLNPAADLIFGVPVDADGGLSFDDDMNTPDVGYGFIQEGMSGGVFYYRCIFYPRVKFATPGMEMNTREAEIDWQTQELSCKIFRSKNGKHRWMYLGKWTDNQSEAIAELNGRLAIAAVAPRLTALSIGSLTLDPTFDPETFAYTASTTNTTNTVTATAASGMTVTMTLNGTAMDTQSATWEDGENTLAITVTSGTETQTYTITVTKG